LVKQGSKVTPEQLEEFMESFKLFDKENKGALTPLQFSGVLQSLGVDGNWSFSLPLTLTPSLIITS